MTARVRECGRQPRDREARGRRTFGAASAAVTGATMLTNLLAYLVPMVGARRLSAAELSTLATLLALGAIATVPGLGLQIAIAVHRARRGGHQARPGPTPVTRLTLVTAALSGLAVVAAAPLLAAALHLAPGLIALLAAMTLTVVLGCRWLGEIQGDQRFPRLAVALTVFALGRYAAVAAGLLLGAGLTGSLIAGVATGALVLPLLAQLAAPGRPTAPGPATAGATPTEPATAGPATSGSATAGPAATGSTPVGPTTAGPVTCPGPPAAGTTLGGRQVVAASSATLAMLALSYADLILARQLLPAAESGAYAVGSVLTKGAIWAPQVVTVLALPKLARGDRRTRTVAVAVVAAGGAVLVAASALAGGLAFRLAGGPGYTDLARYAPFFAATGALYAVVFLLTSARVAAGARRPAGPLWVATATLAVVAGLVAPRTLGGILACSVATAAATTAVLAWLNHGERKRAGRGVG